MILSRKRSLKTSLGIVGAAAILTTALPATASADIVDDALARIPAGQISCEQAEQYWTTEEEYNSYAQQARAAAVFHPRGGEIRDALHRIDEAADRCGLKGGATGGTNNGGGTGGNANNNGGGNANNGGNNNAPAPAPAPANNGPVITIPVPSGTPTVSIPVADVATVVAPDVQKIIDDALSSNPLAQLSSI